MDVFSLLRLCDVCSRMAKAAENQPATTNQLTPSAPNAPPPGTASYSAQTDGVNIHFNNILYFNPEEPTATDSGQIDSHKNIYERVDDEPKEFRYYDQLSASPNGAAAAAAAAGIYEVVRDDVEFAASDDRSGDAGNVYDTIDDEPPTSLTSSTSALPSPLRSPTEADRVYLHVQPRSSSETSPSEPASPLQPQSSALVLNDNALYKSTQSPTHSSSPPPAAAAAGVYVPMGLPHRRNSSASPSLSEPTPPSLTPAEPDNVYVEPTNLTNDVPCSYELAERAQAKPAEGACANNEC